MRASWWVLTTANATGMQRLNVPSDTRRSSRLQIFGHPSNGLPTLQLQLVSIEEDLSVLNIHHHQPINVPIAGAQAFLHNKSLTQNGIDTKLHDMLKDILTCYDILRHMRKIS
jgi:hypothetical protein